MSACGEYIAPRNKDATENRDWINYYFLLSMFMSKNVSFGLESVGETQLMQQGDASSSNHDEHVILIFGCQCSIRRTGQYGKTDGSQSGEATRR
jgi:hypothetical protein